ncbi:MAG: class I SAM-dependent methyltransferase [Treponema sp.]|nr:class I SAM-dependent methyltransferase [Treponema sp.]
MIDYTADSIRAVDAKYEAQKIAFSPLAFQAVRAMLDLGVLRGVGDAGERGLSRGEIAQKARISEYGAGVLAEMGLGLRLLRRAASSGKAGGEERFTLGKTGWFFLEDEMTGVNFNFVNDVCYRGAWELGASLREGRPAGLSVFGGEWKTIYEALSSLPEGVKKSWFDFDHFYSDIAFPEALPLVFASGPKSIVDIGGNTAKWAIACCTYNPEVSLTIVDLPGQTALAEKNAAAAGFADRIKMYPGNVLDRDLAFPSGADALWMSQFLDCFSLEQISGIAEKAAAAAGPETDVFVLEPLWDMQRFEASSYSLQAISLYFTCMANGCSKMYRYGELKEAIEKGGLVLAEAHHNLGSNAYSLLRFRKRPG